MVGSWWGTCGGKFRGSEFNRRLVTPSTQCSTTQDIILSQTPRNATYNT